MLAPCLGAVSGSVTNNRQVCHGNKIAGEIKMQTRETRIAFKGVICFVVVSSPCFFLLTVSLMCFMVVCPCLFIVSLIFVYPLFPSPFSSSILNISKTANTFVKANKNRNLCQIRGSSCYEYSLLSFYELYFNLLVFESLPPEPQWIEVLVDVLLKLMSMHSHLGRVIAACVFRLLSEHITPSAVALITEVNAPELVEPAYYQNTFIDCLCCDVTLSSLIM